MNIKKSLKEKIVVNSIVGNLLLPQIASVAVSNLGTIINGILAGNYYSSDALAAVGFSAPLILVINLFRVTINGGANILCGKALGNGDNEQTKEIFRTTMFLYFISGGIFALIIFVFAENIAYIAGAKGNILLITAQYLKGLSFGFIPTLLVTGIISFLPYANDSIFAFISSLILAVSSLVLGVISQNCFNSGVIGLAFASSLSQFLTLLFLCVRCLLNKNIKKYISFSFRKLNFKLAIQIIYLGTSAAFLSICNVITPIIIVSKIPEVGGILAVAAYGIQSSISGLVYSVTKGIAQVSTMIVSVHLGVKDISSARNSLNYLLAVSTLLVGLECILVSIFAPQIAISFGATGELIPIAIKTTRILSIYTFAISAENIIIAVYQCEEKFKELYILYLFVNLILPISYVFAFEKILGIDAIWTCWLFADLCSYIYYIFMSIKIRKKMPSSFDQICIPENLSDTKRITANIQTTEQTAIFSDNVIKFCKENGINDNKSYYCGLCVEELISNTIQHGFSKSKKKFLGVDAYVSISDDKIFIRIMDNAKLFDPLKKLGMAQNTILENLGLNIVNNASGNFSYRPIYGSNTVYLTFCIDSNNDTNEPYTK